MSSVSPRKKLKKTGLIKNPVEFGDPTGNRTPVTAVKGRCLDRLTMGPKIKRQRPTFPGGLPPSIISAKELNFCVRYGNRCILLAIVTA